MIYRITSVIITLILIFSIGFTSYADTEPTLIKGFATAYNGPSDHTYTGKPVHEGICGGCEAYIGKTIILYQRLPGDQIGEVIGIYECEDTGPGTDGFREGRVIDVWKPKDNLQDFMDRVYEDECQGKVWIQIVEDCNG